MTAEDWNDDEIALEQAQDWMDDEDINPSVTCKVCGEADGTHVELFTDKHGDVTGVYICDGCCNTDQSTVCERHRPDYPEY